MKWRRTVSRFLVVFSFVLFVLAVPAGAEVQITCQPEVMEPNIVIGYNCTAAEEVRCFALNIKLDFAQAITAVECLSDDYYVYPGGFSYDGSKPDFGFCVCDASRFPVDTLGGLDTNGVTIEMCSLYADDDPDHNDPPAASNGLVKITVSGETCITITENSLRGGGVLLVDNTVDPDPCLPDPRDCCIESGCCCVPPGPECVQWKLQGKPRAWCCGPGQWLGDATGDGNTNVLDLFAVKKAYGKTFAAGPWGTGNGQYNCAADFNHDGKVNVLDLFIVKQNYGQTVGVACADITNCPSGP